MIGNTKVVLSSYSYKWSLGFRKFQPKKPRSLFWFIDKAKEFEIDGIQIADNVKPEDLNDYQCKRLYEYAVEKGIELQWGFDGWDTGKVKRLIDICTITNAVILRGVFGKEYFPKLLGKDEKIQKASDAILEIIPLLEKNRIVLAMENHFDLKIEEFITVIRKINHPQVKVCLDTTNALGEIITPIETVETLAPISVGMHFKDFKITKIIGGYNILGTAIGLGNQDCLGVLSRALEINPDIEVCIELGTPWPEDESIMFEQEESQVNVSVVNTKNFLTLINSKTPS